MATATKAPKSMNHEGTPELITFVIPPLQQQVGVYELVGTAPYMQLRFSQKAMDKMKSTQMAGQQARSKKTREARNFDDDYHQAMHLMEDGRHGIPASSFRNAMISACRTIGFKMTLAKLSVFVEADGLDSVDGTPLVHLIGDPEKTEMPVRNATGVADIRVRPMWRNWSAKIRIRFDLQQFSSTDIMHLLIRAGAQVGIGEGRPDSRQSAGLGYGLFDVKH